MSWSHCGYVDAVEESGSFWVVADKPFQMGVCSPEPFQAGSPPSSVGCRLISGCYFHVQSELNHYFRSCLKCGAAEGGWEVRLRMIELDSSAQTAILTPADIGWKGMIFVS